MATDPERIRHLNDEFRRELHFLVAPMVERRLVATRGVAARGGGFVDRAVRAVRSFSDFTEDNDPYGEHDFGAFELDGQKVFWKIDYYDLAGEFASPEPSDPLVTRRVLTIMLAEEY